MCSRQYVVHIELFLQDPCSGRKVELMVVGYLIQDPLCQKWCAGCAVCYRGQFVVFNRSRFIFSPNNSLIATIVAATQICRYILTISADKTNLNILRRIQIEIRFRRMLGPMCRASLKTVHSCP